jgi:hypothetical protein
MYSRYGGTYVPEPRPSQYMSAVTGRPVTRRTATTRRSKSFRFAPETYDPSNRYYKSSNVFQTVVEAPYSSVPRISEGRVRYQSNPTRYFTKNASFDTTIPYDEDDARRVTKLVESIWKKKTNQDLSDELSLAVYKQVLQKPAPRKKELFDKQEVSRRINEVLVEVPDIYYDRIDPELFSIAIVGGKTSKRSLNRYN